MNPKKEPTVGMSVSLPISQVNRIIELADEKDEAFSATLSRLVKLGFVYLRALDEQSKAEDEAIKAADDKRLEAILRARAEV